MAKQIGMMFQEVKLELVKILLLNVILETAIVFLAAHLVFSIFSMKMWYSAVIAVIVFIARFWHGARQMELKRIEEKNPELKEMLRTAYDNQEGESLMVIALFQEVLDKMRRVSSGTFISLEKIVKRVGIIFVLSIVLVSLAFFNIDIAKFQDPLERPIKAVGDWIKGLGDGTPTQEEFQLDDQGLYGEARMADLGEDQLNLQINPSLNEVDFSALEDPEALSDNIKDFPGEAVAVRAESDTSGLEDVADRKTAAEYSQRVKEIK